jgi:hypothetical protein
MTFFVVCVCYFTDNVNVNTKEEVITKIKSMENSATSVLCSLSAHEKQQNHFLEDIIGVVALLGSVQSPELSRFVKCFHLSHPSRPKKTNTLNNLAFHYHW